MRGFLKKVFVKNHLNINGKNAQEMASFSPLDSTKTFYFAPRGVQEYDLVDYDFKNLMGHLQKRFMLVDRRYFASFISGVKSRYPNESYISYLDSKDVVEGNIPQKLSCMVKSFEEKDSSDYPSLGVHNYEMFKEKMYKEVVVSRILNFMGSKTVYNAPCIVHKGGRRTPDYYVLSLDFIPKNHVFYSANSLYSVNGNRLGVESLVDSASDAIPLIKKEEFKLGIKDFANTLSKRRADVNIKNIKEDVVYSYLCRVFLLNDKDFFTRNLGYLVNTETGEISLGPGFDFEMTLEKQRRFNFEAIALRDLQYIIKNYPQVLDRFINMVNEISQIDKKRGIPIYKKLIHKEIGEVELTNQFSAIIKGNIEQIQVLVERARENNLQIQMQ